MEKPKEKKQRTLAQNRALYKYFTQLADELNFAGLDMKKVLKPEIDIIWTPESIKNYLWRPVQRSMYNKESTTELTTDEITKIYEVLNRFTGEKHGISLLFPSIDSIFFELISSNDTQRIR